MNRDAEAAAAEIVAIAEILEHLGERLSDGQEVRGLCLFFLADRIRSAGKIIMPRAFED